MSGFSRNSFRIDPYEQTTAVAVVSQLRADIECDKFISFKPGLSAEKHLEMNTLEIMRKESAESIAQQREIARESREQLEKHHDEMMEYNRSVLNLKTDIKAMIEEHRQKDKSDAKKDREDDNREAARIRDEDQAKSQKWRRQDRSLALMGLTISMVAIVFASIIGLIQAGKLFWPDLTK